MYRFEYCKAKSFKFIVFLLFYLIVLDQPCQSKNSFQSKFKKDLVFFFTRIRPTYSLYISHFFMFINKEFHQQKSTMTTIRDYTNYEQKPGARYTIVRDFERKERQLNKYLNTCQLQRQVNPECKPKRSELISKMYEQKKVMKKRTCRRTGAQEFNFKKQSAKRIISNMRTFQKESKFRFNSKILNKREIEDNYFDDSQEE